MQVLTYSANNMFEQINIASCSDFDKRFQHKSDQTFGNYYSKLWGLVMALKIPAHGLKTATTLTNKGLNGIGYI